MGRAKGKYVFGYMRTAKAHSSLSIRAVRSGPLLSATECINGEKMPGCDFAHACDEPESLHFRMLEDTFLLILF